MILLAQSCGVRQASPFPSGASRVSGAPAHSTRSGRVAELALGDRHSCARLVTGQVICWGDNRYGQLGDGSGRRSLVPVFAKGVVDAVQLSSNDNSTCARRATGAVVCWGSNDRGQVVPDRTRAATQFTLDPALVLGVDTRSPADPGNVRPTPTPVLHIDDAVDVSLGLKHSCAVRLDGSVLCWGDNSVGQLGVSAPAEPFQQQRVPILEPVSQVRAAGLYSCARAIEGGVWCWGGYNESEQLGHRGASSLPRKVGGVVGSEGLTLDPSRACSRSVDEHWLCWGTSARCAEAAPLSRAAEDEHLRQVRQFASAYNACFRCVLSMQGAVDCSFTENGEDGVMNLPAIEQLAAGTEHACALSRAGEVFCWGDNAAGQLGRVTARNFDVTPKKITF